ncbi:Shufflon-specific DNA recombinase [Candidatus Burkholderia pumila]|uniref:Shufflon-specific DNA recombinase n=1 Tax=Candidatus Burkholderia pumila TaxID=1090375 RepID=A0ABR5HL47_9BURK|nr:Shufflon-specific DNA recombinase [Candidatus Burkholderia pumila]
MTPIGVPKSASADINPYIATLGSRLESGPSGIEAEISIGVYVDRTEVECTTLADAHRYEREIVPTKRYLAQERTRIARWKKHNLAWRPLAALRGTDFAKYRDARRAGRAENTIRLELQVISHLFEIARKEWGFEIFMNPVKNIRKP